MTNIVGNLFVSKSAETFGYDAHGNTTNDGRWTYTWDGENRLVKVESRADTPQVSWRKVEWEYDALGRRIRQTTSDGSSGTWQVTEDLKFVSDPVLLGRHIAELNATNNALARSYVWGLDLSGTLDGAGGVGGLLCVTMNSGPTADTHFVAYDGNGNVVGLVSANTGTETARYEYGPFAESIRLSGPAGRANSFRFSTKRTDETTDLVLYEYRAYSPTLGRWPNRDPIEEEGGLNLYGMVDNDPVNFIDLWGLWRIERKGEARAKAYPDHGDTIRSLADEIKLNASEWRLWLKIEKTSVANLDLDTPLDCFNALSVPNTAFVDASSYSWGGLGWYLMNYSLNLRSAWKSEGLKVVYTSTWSTTKDSIIGHLGSDDIYKYAYIGHGASGQLIGVKDPKGKGDEKGILAAGKYTKYGIARMEIIACESNDSSHMWKKNVSKKGVLRTIKGLFKLFNMDFVDEEGE